MKTLLLFILLGTPQTHAAPFSERMQTLYSQLTKLLTDVSSDARFNDSSNKSRIEKEIKDFAASAHEFKHKDLANSKVDPTLSILSTYLVDETKDAYEAFKNGRTARAQSILRSIPGTCINCHGRSDFGPQFEKLAFEPSETYTKPGDLGKFYAATRQFDRALEQFQKVIASEEIASQDPWGWEESIHQVLSISVRVKKDPKLTLKIINEALAQKKAPHYLKESLHAWKESTESWQKEKALKKPTETELLVFGKSLMKKAQWMQAYPMDHNADLLYLRASSLFYDLLQLAPEGKHVSEALLWEGISNEVMLPRGLEGLHQAYYEACIQKTPHSKIAVDCYRHYEQSAILGFTGSAGTALPEEVKQKILDLWSLALPAGQKSDQLY